MKTLEWTTVEKSDWGPGPWQDEPDKRQWVDPTTGLACLINRGPSGGLCGYVGVPPGHVLHGEHYWSENGDQPIDRIEVHGGLTFADHCQTTDNEAAGICHVIEPGDPDPVWWLGFDCAHFRDYVPELAARLPSLYNTSDHVYRDFEWVTAEVSRLAAQVAELS